MLNINAIISKNNEDLAIKAIDFLQTFLLLTNDNDIELLDSLEQLAQIKLHFNDISLLQTENISEYTDDQYTVTERFPHLTTEIENIFLKLDYLKIKYPENKNIIFVEKSIAKDFQEHIKIDGRVKNKEVLEYKANIILNNSSENYISDHKVLKIAETLLEKVQNYSKTFHGLSELTNFWNENNHFFTTQPMNGSKYLENDIFVNDIQNSKNFQFKGSILKNKIKNEDTMVINQIKIIQQIISEKLFTHFALFPEQHERFANEICPFFSFTDWSQNPNKHYLNLQWTEDHINLLSKYNNVIGYDYYIEEIFKINMKEMFNLCIPGSQPSDDIMEKSTKNLEDFLKKKLNYDKLFENNKVGLPENIQRLFSEIQNMTIEDFFTNIKECNVFIVGEESLDYYYQTYKNKIKKLSNICLLNKLSDIPVSSKIIKKIKI